MNVTKEYLKRAERISIVGWNFLCVRMFFICKDRCMCTSPMASAPGASAEPTVLYCFGEVRHMPSALPVTKNLWGL